MDADLKKIIDKEVAKARDPATGKFKIEDVLDEIWPQIPDSHTDDVYRYVLAARGHGRLQ